MFSTWFLSWVFFTSHLTPVYEFVHTHTHHTLVLLKSRKRYWIISFFHVTVNGAFVWLLKGSVIVHLLSVLWKYNLCQRKTTNTESSQRFLVFLFFPPSLQGLRLFLRALVSKLFLLLLTILAFSSSLTFTLQKEDQVMPSLVTFLSISLAFLWQWVKFISY